MESPSETESMNYQQRVMKWAEEAFGQTDAHDMNMRRHRFLEEAIELAQAAGGTLEELIQIAQYVHAKPPGEMKQEVGGTMVTLGAFCEAHGIDMRSAGEEELARCWKLIEKIREKHRNKPAFGPLPVNLVPRAVGDAINHPDHYGGADNVYEAIKVIDAWELGFCLGNTLKYIKRAGKKLDPGVEVIGNRHVQMRARLKDLKKSRWYLDHEIQQLEQSMAAGSAQAEVTK